MNYNIKFNTLFKDILKIIPNYLLFSICLSMLITKKFLQNDKQVFLISIYRTSIKEYYVCIL